MTIWWNSPIYDTILVHKLTEFFPDWGADSPSPPLTGGNYFSAHYHLGHKKFQSAEPEVFLFGELSDINFLGSKPAAVRISFLMLCFSLSQFLTFLLLYSFPTNSLPNRSQSNALGVSSIFREIPLNSSSKHLRVLFSLCSMMTCNLNMTFCGMESGHSTVPWWLGIRICHSVVWNQDIAHLDTVSMFPDQTTLVTCTTLSSPLTLMWTVGLPSTTSCLTV